MDALQFVASFEWPLVATGAVVVFRKNLRTWFSERPKKLKAGPLEMEWDSTVKKTVEQLETERIEAEEKSGGEAQAEPSGPEERTGPDQQGQPESRDDINVPPEPLFLRLRDVARIAPAGAITEAWAVIEAELRLVVPPELIKNNYRMPYPTMFALIKAVESHKLLPEWCISILDSLRRLRNLAAHAVEPISNVQAYDFLYLCDLLRYEIRNLGMR